MVDITTLTTTSSSLHPINDHYKFLTTWLRIIRMVYHSVLFSMRSDPVPQRWVCHGWCDGNSSMLSAAFGPWKLRAGPKWYPACAVTDLPSLIWQGKAVSFLGSAIIDQSSNTISGKSWLMGCWSQPMTNQQAWVIIVHDPSFTKLLNR